MKILLVYPECPDTFWSFKYALQFIGRKAAYPPLGLLTVAAMLPDDWQVKLVDQNVAALETRDIQWADFVMISAMSIQQATARAVIERCHALGRKVVAGGPLFTMQPDAFADVDVLVLGEAEVTLPPFVDDVRHGRVQRRYTATSKPDLRSTPVPRWELIDFKRYAAMSLQMSRGCPFDCDFCTITTLFGHTPRVKDAVQIVAELERLYRLGWRGNVFFVDDNFIGQKRHVKEGILPAIIAWMQRMHYPFTFNTEVSLNLADDVELMRLMVRAGFNTVFIGLESSNDESLQECNKIPNKNRNLMASVKTIQQHGLQVQGGFILGFDSDPVMIFDRLIAFIQESGIVTAMVGLLNAPLGTRLYQRLLGEGRLLHDISGDSTDCSLNFIPHMPIEILLHGYQHVLATIYAPMPYYRRVKQFLREFRPSGRHLWRLAPQHLSAFCKSLLVLGIMEKERVYFWRLFFWSLFTRPALLPWAITFAAYGFHFRKCVEQQLHAVI